MGARLETSLAPCWDRLFGHLADGFEKLLNVRIMALELLFKIVKPCADSRISESLRLSPWHDPRVWV